MKWTRGSLRSGPWWDMCSSICALKMCANGAWVLRIPNWRTRFHMETGCPGYVKSLGCTRARLAIVFVDIKGCSLANRVVGRFASTILSRAPTAYTNCVWTVRLGAVVATVRGTLCFVCPRFCFSCIRRRTRSPCGLHPLAWRPSSTRWPCPLCPFRCRP